MTIDINEELRRLAQEATSGEWYVERGNHIYGRNEVTDGEEVWHPVIACTDDDEVNVNFEANAAFIAAANPAAISELLDCLEATEKERDALRAKITEMEKQEPAGEVVHNGESAGLYDILEQGALLYALPGAQQLVQLELSKREISEAHNDIARRLSALADDNTALRAKIEEMKKRLEEN